MGDDDETIERLLTRSRVVAVVGLTDREDRPSHRVAKYLQSVGYRIIPVNPMLEGAVLGERPYPGLDEVPEQVDIVDIFRRPEDVPPIVEAAIRKGAPAVWMQLGIAHHEAAALARAAGLDVVMDHCMAVEHRKLVRLGKLKAHR